MNELSDFKHSIPVQIRFSDIDRVNHVNNAVYHTYIETGRVHYLNEVLHRHTDWMEMGFVLVRTEIDHLRQVHLRDEIYCFTRILSIGNKSLRIAGKIVKKSDDGLIVCASATGVLVAMDFKADRSIVIPDSWREQIRKYEGLND